MTQTAASCATHGIDKIAVKAALGSANMIFIIALVLGILSCGLGGFTYFRKMGLPITIAALIFGLVGSIVSVVFYMKKGKIDECIKMLYPDAPPS